MKHSYCILFLLIVLGCNSVKTNEIEINNFKNSKPMCPKDGVCTFEVLENKALFILKDGIGATYPKIEAGNKTILKFEYKRNQIPDTLDGHYSEIIYVEVDSDIEKLNLQNKSLHEAKLLFGRLCFCRGQTGYYPINEGELTIRKNNNGSRQFELNFKTSEVPQIISSISESF